MVFPVGTRNCLPFKPIELRYNPRKVTMWRYLDFATSHPFPSVRLWRVYIEWRQQGHCLPLGLHAPRPTAPQVGSYELVVGDSDAVPVAWKQNSQSTNSLPSRLMIPNSPRTPFCSLLNGTYLDWLVTCRSTEKPAGVLQAEEARQCAALHAP